MVRGYLKQQGPKTVNRGSSRCLKHHSRGVSGMSRTFPRSVFNGRGARESVESGEASTENRTCSARPNDSLSMRMPGQVLRLSGDWVGFQSKYISAMKPAQTLRRLSSRHWKAETKTALCAAGVQRGDVRITRRRGHRQQFGMRRSRDLGPREQEPSSKTAVWCAIRRLRQVRISVRDKDGFQGIN